MICKKCRKKKHDKCKGGTHCFCQHRTNVTYASGYPSKSK